MKYHHHDDQMPIVQIVISLLLIFVSNHPIIMSMLIMIKKFKITNAIFLLLFMTPPLLHDDSVFIYIGFRSVLVSNGFLSHFLLLLWVHIIRSFCCFSQTIYTKTDHRLIMISIGLYEKRDGCHEVSDQMYQKKHNGCCLP